MATITWITLCSIIIFFLQAGFTCYESGIVQSKNVMSVAMENLFSLSIGILTFASAGFFIMFGRMPQTAEEYAFFLGQIMFAVTSVTIFAGAMSERSRFLPLVIAAGISSLLIYPVFGRLVWFSQFNDSQSFLEELGYIDFAGASIVHATAGFIALAGVLVVGSRKETSKGFSNVPQSVLGIFILWFGWFGFNVVMLPPDDARIPLVIVNVILAAASGVVGSIFVNLVTRRKGHYLLSSFDGVLSGLVAITALSAYTRPWGAVLVGFIAGIVAYFVNLLMEKKHIDDAVHAVPTHLTGAVVGILAVAFLSEPQYLAAGSCFRQFLVQLLGISIDGVWSFSIAFIMFKLMDRFLGLRVSEDEEYKGLNIVDFEDIYSWENYMARNSYENEIYEKNILLRKQARLLAVTEEQEKERLAHDLHDGVGQSLSALKVMAGLQKLQADAGDLDGTRASAEKTEELAKNALSEMRNVLNNLRPDALVQGGLGHGIESMVENINASGAVVCKITNTIPLPEFDETVELNIYRAIQECLTNVVKHANASECTITYHDNPHKRRFTFVIIDNGKGFQPDTIESRGLGLSSMEDRLNMLEGRFRLDSIIGKGTQITMEVPY